LGGYNELWNLVMARAGCNPVKNGKDFWAFMETMKGKQTQILKRLDCLRKKLPRKMN
jgi:hypothetical protein